MGLTKQEIKQKVDERCYTETEDIYGEIYGNMDTIADDEVYVIITILITQHGCTRMCIRQILQTTYTYVTKLLLRLQDTH